MKIKRATVALVAVAALLVSCGEEGSYFNDNTTQLKSDRVGRLEAVGTDMRVYEFTPQTNPNRRCLMVTGENKGGLNCWDKSEEKPRG